MRDTVAISLRFGFDGCRVRLRELTGHDERRVRGTSTADALQLLEAVCLAVPGAEPPPCAEDLVAADRDQILAAVYGQTFGDRIESTLRCGGCAEPFDLHFSLRQLAGALNRRPRNAAFVECGANVFESAGGWRFRLPTGRDECAVAATAPEAAEMALAARCSVDAVQPPDLAALQNALEEIAPLFEFELKATCPECNRVHLVQFDIQTYLLRSLLNEQGRLTAEIHRVATAYGWRFEEILALKRTERRRLVGLIESETSRRLIPR
jgi:hypothetical protein